MRTLLLIFNFSLLIVLNSCKIEGCTDPSSLNYNPKANYNKDNSCEYLKPPIIISPLNNTTVDTNFVAFSWKNQQNIDSYIFELSDNDKFESNILVKKNLKDTTLKMNELFDGNYYWRVRSIKGKLIISEYSETRKFSYNSKKLNLTTLAIYDITSNSAKTGGIIINNDITQGIIQKGVCYNTSSNPVFNQNDYNSYTNQGNGLTNFYSTLQNILPNTKYYVRAYLKGNFGITYGNEISFTTLKEKTLPKLTTYSNITNITPTTARVQGYILDNGNDIIIQQGICYSSTTTNPKISNSTVYSTIGSNSIIGDLSNLASNKTYYACSFAKNSLGISYGNVVSFTTNNFQIPSLNTQQISSITSNSAISGGYNITDGGTAIIQQGTCWSSTTTLPTTLNSKTINTGTSSFVSNLTNLTASTTYYVRAYATNTMGTGYGNTISFTTAAITPLSVSTLNSTSITSNSAKINFNLASIGSSSITSIGVCYSYTLTSPTVTNSIKTTYNGIGNYSVTLTSLLSKKKYYVRAYATNATGTSYGAVITFTTL